ncbi:MAG: hypothetical protein JWP81_381 [Ferruginibacter sp.]|nr:hypothetical protein [Ferruginibacter sp.]
MDMPKGAIPGTTFSSNTKTLQSRLQRFGVIKAWLPGYAP